MVLSFSALSLREDVVGLDMGAGLAVAARVKQDRQGRLRLKEVGWTSYNPKGTPDDIAVGIRRMWRKGGLSRFSVVSCLRSRALTLKRFQYPPLAEAELASALRLEAEETLQMSQEDVALDWQLNPESAENAQQSARQVSGTLVAVPRSEVDAHLKILTRAALLPVATDVSCFALVNLFRACMPPETLNSVFCLARLGTQSADISMVYNGTSVYPRTVFVHAGQAADPAKYFAESIKDFLAYCRFKLHLPDLDKLYVTGVVDAGKQTAIEGAVDVPVELWDPLAQVYGMSQRISRRLKEADQPVRAGVAVAMGLALRGDLWKS